MHHILNWFRSWTVNRRAVEVNKSMIALRRQIIQVSRDKRNSDREIEELKTNFKKSLEVLENAQILNKKLEQTLEASEQALELANKVVIPALMAANETFQTSWDAQISNHVRAAVANRPGTGDVE